MEGEGGDQGSGWLEVKKVFAFCNVMRSLDDCVTIMCFLIHSRVRFQFFACFFV